MEDLTEMLKGILEGIILEVISRGETYGYEITKTLQELGFEDVVEGTVYTILLRLERQNLVTVTRRKSDIGPMRKFFTLNAAGEQALAAFWQKWAFITTRLSRLREFKE